MHTAFLPKAFALAAALAALSSLPAHAGVAGWFDAGIGDYDSWPSDGSDKAVQGAGTWSGTANATLDAGALAVDAGAGDWLSFEAEQTVDAAASNVVYTASVTLSSIAEIVDIPAPAAGAKTGLTVAKSGASNAWFAWARDPAGATNAWIALEAAVPATGSSTGIRISLKTDDGALWAQYEVGETALTADGTNWLQVATEDPTLHGATLGGSGYSVSALSASTVAEDIQPPPPAVLTLAALPENVTLVSVTTNDVAVAAVEGAYTVLSNATVAVTFAPAEGYRLVGAATVTVVMDGDRTLATADMPAAEPIPPPPATVTLTIPSPLPANVTLVSVTTNGVAVSGVEGAYTVLSNDTVTVTFAADEGYRLVGSATVDVAMDGNKTLESIPTAELIPIPTATLTIPSPLPENVTLVSVTTNGVAVAGAEGAYTVYSNATVVATFAAAEGYVLTGDATVSVVVDGDKTLTGIPTAVSIAARIKINEIMASNPSLDKGGIASEKGIAEMDWIEIYNGSPQTVDLTGWYLSDSDKKGKEDKATILGSCVIPAGGYKIVWLDKIHTNAAEYAASEAFAVLKLSSSGDLIQLADPNKTVVDKINFKDKPQIKGYSYGPLSVVYNGNPVPGDGDPVYMKTATPGAANVTEGWGDFTPAVTFSEPHGYKTEAFDLTLSCEADPTAAIYYTLDGTSPTTASTPYTGAIHVDRTTVVRAAVPDPTSVLQFDTSATYIFLDDVLAQAQSGTAPASAVGFPNDNAVNNQEMLYGMRQSVVTGADSDRLLRGFTNSIATLSVVVDPANLFNSTTGIYVNPRGDGVEWERQIMLEGFDPTGVGADFAQPAGIRLRGGYSRREAKPKHSFRFFFRSSYGVSSLAAKMFVGEPLSMNGEGKMKEEAGEYDKLDLRTSQNNSWANDDNPANDTFVTEVFSRDSQRDLGQPYTRSRYYNLFINGQYWGLYQTQERGDEHWAESYLGGDSLQYDLIKTGTSYKGTSITYSIECNEGTWDAWSNLWRIATQEGFGEGHYDNYNKVLGLDANGDRDPSLPILLNPESLMVYMLVSHYVVDRDGPTSPFSGLDKGHANNFYAIRNRDDAGRLKGFVFLRHDAEMSMDHGAHTTASDNPTFWGTEECTEFTGAAKHRNIPYFTPAELHYLLMKNPTYKRAYADLFYRECLREGGAMTVENATERYVSRMNEITDAIVCEAARWGKGKTRSTWVAACATSTAFITNRLTNMKSQYQAVGWYPTNTPPFVVSETGVRYFDGDEVPYLAKVCLTNNEAGGTIYYTTNGVDDPMDAGVAYTGGFDIPDEGFTVRARLLKDGEWSAMEEVALEADIPNDQRYGIRVAAILNAAVNDPADEFIVLTNKLDREVSLEGISIWSEKVGQTLVKLAEIGAGTNLAAGATITLTQPANWIGDTKLKNGDIYVELRDFNGKRIQNARVDSGTWFPTGQFNDKGKEIHACDKTGRWFVALEFLGDAEEGGAPGGEVVLESQWAPSPEAPSTVALTVPAVANATMAATTNGVAIAGEDDGNGSTVFTIEPGTAATVTYTAAEGYHVSGSANDVTTVDYEVSAADTAADYTLAVDTTMAINVYTVTFAWHGGSSEETYEHGTPGSDVAVPRNPPSYVEDGRVYAFAGWSAAVPGTIVSDMAIDAVYDDGTAVKAAVISVADAETGACTTNAIYTTLAEAVAAASDGETVLLLDDDSASFTAQNPEIGINKAITIDGDGHTLYGLDDYAGGSGDHDIYISGSGDITIKNIKLADFGGAVPVSGRTYPIWTGSAYAGTLTLDNVTVESFNRTAFNLNGGTVVVKDCTIVGDTTKNPYFQEGIAVYNADVTVENTTITGAGSTYEKEDSQIAACIQLGNPNGPAPGTGSILVKSGAFAGEYGIIIASNALNAVTVQDGTFNGALLAEEGEGGTIVVNGGLFDAPVPAEFAGANLAPTTIADNNGMYTVRTARTVDFKVDGVSYTNLVVADGEPVAQPPDPAKADHVFKGWTLDGSAYDFAAPVTADIELAASFTDLGAAVWIGGASGAWDDASKWDIGCVPTRATVVTFTNDAEVAILADQDHCKKMVLDAGVTIVPAGAGETHLIFWGDDGVATSGAGTLTTDGVTLFKAAGSGTLAMNAPLAFASSVALTGNHSGSSILALNGPVTLGDGVTVTSSYIDYVEVRGGLTVPAGATATLSLRNYEMTTYRLYSAMTLVHPADEEGPATTLRLPHSFVIFNSGAGVVTDSDDWYVKAETSTPYDTYTVLRKAPAAFTVLWVVDNETVRTDTDVPAGTTTNWVGELPSKATDERYSYAFGSWTTNGVDVAPAEVAIVADTTFAARFALSPLPMDPGQNLTAADLAGENRPIATTNAMFTVKFRTKTPLATYRLVASPTLVGVDWTAATAVGEPATSDAEIPDGGQLMTLAAPMGEDAPPVRFFKIRASLEEP